MVEIGLSKYSAININALIPLISFFTVIVLITDIVILSQQQIISKQQHDLANYNVYQPMMDDLIEDVTGRQHDFDNILTGIRMLPYTHTDYSSLKEALISSSDEVISEYRTTELLKINMFVIAGFIYSKQKQAEKAHKKLNIVVHSYLLESRMPEYELVRVLGILIDNALEAISEHDSMTLHLDSRDGRIIITTLNNDIYCKLRKNASQREQKIFVNVGVVVWTVIWIMIGKNAASILGQLTGATQIKSVASVILLISLYWKRVDRNSGFYSLLTGSVVAMGWHLAGNPFGIQPLWPSLAISLVLLVILTLLSPAPVSESSQAVDAIFKEYDALPAEKK